MLGGIFGAVCFSPERSWEKPVYIFIRGIKERVTIQSVVDRGSNNFCNFVSISRLQVEYYHGIIVFTTGNICMSKNTMLRKYQKSKIIL